MMWTRGGADRRRRLAPWMGAGLLLCVGALKADPTSQDAGARVSIAEILRHLRTLGDDAMEGRGTGTAGGERAAAYLESQLARLDLEPLGGDGGYRQAVPLHGSLPLASSRLTLAAADGRQRTLTLWDDYVLFDTGAQTFLPRPVPLTFVAYGIVAPEYDYNDYQRAEVAGRIAVFMAGEPPSEDPSYFDGERGRRLMAWSPRGGSAPRPAPEQAAVWPCQRWSRSGQCCPMSPL